MADSDETQRKIDWKMAGGVGGIASVVLAFSLNTAKDAQIALSVADQHGQEILMLQQSIDNLRNEMRSRTQERYTSRDADRDFRYLDERLKRCEKHLEQVDTND